MVRYRPHLPNHRMPKAYRRGVRSRHALQDIQATSRVAPRIFARCRRPCAGIFAPPIEIARKLEHRACGAYAAHSRWCQRSVFLANMMRRGIHAAFVVWPRGAFAEGCCLANGERRLSKGKLLVSLRRRCLAAPAQPPARSGGHALALCCRRGGAVHTIKDVRIILQVRYAGLA